MRRIRQLKEDNKRHRRILPEEEQRLLEAAAPHLCLMIIFALNTGMRRDDLEARPGWIRVRGERVKSGRIRWVPIGTARLRAVLDFLRWHDLRHEYASRLVECGVPLSQVRDRLGHASITTTERYDNQTQEALFEAAKRLKTGESFKIAYLNPYLRRDRVHG